MIQKPWKPDFEYSKQPEFQIVKECFFNSVLGDENHWLFVKLKPSKQHDKDKDQQKNY